MMGIERTISPKSIQENDKVKVRQYGKDVSGVFVCAEKDTRRSGKHRSKVTVIIGNTLTDVRPSKVRPA